MQDAGTHSPVFHVAVYKWRANAPIDEIESAMNRLTGIASDVPGIAQITWGRNHSKYSEGYTHVIIVRAGSDADIDAYRHHEIHQPVAELLDRWEDIGIGIDISDQTSLES